MDRELISAKYNELSVDKKKSLQGLMLSLLGDRMGSLGYCDIEGLDLMGIEKKLVGKDTEGFLNCMVDAISLVTKDDSDGVYLCDDYSVNVSKALKIPIAGVISREEITSSWLEDSDFIDVVKDGTYSEDTDDEYNDLNTAVDEDDFDAFDDETKVDETDTEVVNEETEVEPEKRDDSEDYLRQEIKKVFNSTVISIVEKVKRRYDLLYESGYDLERPYGLVSREGILYTDSSKKLLMRENPDKDLDYNATINLYNLFERRVGFVESDARSARVMANDLLESFLNGSKLVYFPYKHLEYAYGRNASSVESDTYNYATMKVSGNVKGVSTNWKDFGVKVKEDIKLTIEDSIVVYCMEVLKTGLEGTQVRDIIRNSDNMNSIKSYIEFIADSLSISVLINQYKSSMAKPVLIKVRVCDPNKTISSDMTETIIEEVFSGNTGGSKGLTLDSGLNIEDSSQYSVYEFNHEFDHNLSNAMPLFAYKAFEKLKEKGESITYSKLILGQSSDGTILRNGTHGLVLDKKLFHYINAGSRSGKGVMTLNMVAAAILSNKAIIYLDNKPDMVSILSELSGGSAYGNEKGPLFFGLNGSNNVDDKQHQFTHEDEWINRANIPIEVVTLFGEPSWSKYGDIFYLKAFTLAYGIILARGLDGGHGKMNDPAYGGKEGIFLVCDETNVLQEKFKIITQIIADKIPLQAKKFKSMSSNLEALYNEANSENARKGSDLKFFNNKRDFEEAFNAHKFYALSFLNTLSDNISYIYDKSLAGFLQKEAEYSDIVIIGQNLEQRPMSKDVITQAVSSARLSGEGSGANGLGGTQIAKEIKGNSSIPLAHFVFNSADALIGYNSIHPEYLAQTENGSKAKGKLDLTANNFCYLPNFKINASGEVAPGEQLTKSLANDSSSVYFKPYLILNNSSSEYTEQMFARVSNAGLSPEDVIREYPNDSGDDISPYIGFPEYMSLMGVDNLSDRLKKGSDIANMVVGDVLGYPDDGSGRPLWLQFVTDLRPEWLVSIRDIACLCGGLDKDANLSKGIDNPLTKEYNDYIKYVKEHPELGIIDNSMSSPDSTFIDDEGTVQYDVTGYESQARHDFYATDDFSNPDLEDEAFEERMHQNLGDNTTFDENEELDIFDDQDDQDDYFKEFSDDAYTNGYSAFNDSEDDNYVGSKVINNSKDDKDLIIEKLLQKLIDNGVDVSDFNDYGINPTENNGVDCGYQVPDYKEEFSSNEFNDVSFDDKDDELTADSFVNLIQLVTSKVLNLYGGLERINTFRVIGGAIVVNGTIFRSKINKNCIGVLPLDIRRKLSTGNISELFNYSLLRSMPNLRSLEFDSTSFVYDHISKAMGYENNIGVNAFFEDIKSLQTLVIAKDKFTRENYMYSLDKDIFYYQGKATKYAYMCDNYLSNVTNKSWTFTKNMFNDKNKNVVTRVFGVLAGGIATVGSGVATLGAKATKGISKSVDKRNRKNSVKRGFNAFKNGLDDLFNS